MKVALMTFEGTLHTYAEWNGKSEHKGMYLRFPNKDYDHYNAVLAIRPEDVEEYTKYCIEQKQKIMELESQIIQFKTKMHHKLIPFKS